MHSSKNSFRDTLITHLAQVGTVAALFLLAACSDTDPNEHKKSSSNTGSGGAGEKTQDGTGGDDVSCAQYFYDYCGPGGIWQESGCHKAVLIEACSGECLESSPGVVSCDDGAGGAGGAGGSSAD